MTKKKHALLSASSSHRWMNCPPSARLCERYGDKGSSYAAEGTCAHELSEYKLRCALGEDLSEVADIREHLSFYDLEMEDAADGYAGYILELLSVVKEGCPDPLVLIEQRINFSEYVAEGFGTCDCLIVADDELIVIDFKYGRGVQVEAEGNSQMRLYALGALEMFDSLYDIRTVDMVIYQPRRDNISSETLSKEELQQWANEVLKPAAELAYTGDGEYNCGDWCQFCRAKAECRKRAEENMALARYDFAEPALLENDEIANILGKLDDLTAWASDVKEYALAESLKGVKFDGWKVVEGRSNRKYTNETAVAEAVTEIGLDPYKHELLGITAMTSLLGKKRFEETLGGLIEKPAGKPTLVTISDKRQELTITSAADDFADHEK